MQRWWNSDNRLDVSILTTLMHLSVNFQCSQKWRWSRWRFNQTWLQAKYESRNV
jgi:hypothetical protein